MLNGIKTLIIFLMAQVYAVLQANGILITEDDQAAIQTAVVAVVFIIVRHFTTDKPAWRRRL